MGYLIDHYEKIVASFEGVLEAMKSLCLHIHDELVGYPLWVDNGVGGFSSERGKVIFALQHLSPILALSPQETFSCPGVVASNLATFVLIDEVNKKKDEFKLMVKQYLGESKADPTRPVRQVLAKAGYGGIKIKQVYRHIHYIHFHPRRFSWTKALTSSNLVIDKITAEKMLQKLGQKEHIQIQLSKLQLLGKEDKLVIYHAIKPCWLANIATFKKHNKRSKSTKIRTSLPIFYLHDFNLSTPEVCFSSKQERKVKHRLNKAIEEVPFLKSINAYRYKPHT